MILRRFMKHVSDQNWFAVGLDVIVVITGIFLGMQVTDWNQARKDNERQNILLDNLESDLAATMALLQVTETRGLTGIQNATRIIEALPNPEQLSKLTDDWSTFVIKAISGSAPQVQLASLKQLASGDQLKYIADPDLQRIILGLYEYIQTRESWSRATIDASLPTFLELSNTFDRRYSVENLDPESGWISMGRIVSTPADLATVKHAGKLFQKNMHMQALLLDLNKDIQVEISKVLSEIRALREEEQSP